MSIKDKIKEHKKKKKIEKVIKNPSFLIKEKNQTEELQIVAVNNHDYMIRYFPNASEKVQLAHIFRWGGKSVFSIIDPTEKVLIEAIKDDFNVFYELENPADNICKAALDLDINCYTKMTNPSENIKKYMLEKIMSDVFS